MAMKVSTPILTIQLFGCNLQMPSTLGFFWLVRLMECKNIWSRILLLKRKRTIQFGSACNKSICFSGEEPS
jgi:hypothetical protein